MAIQNQYEIDFAEVKAKVSFDRVLQYLNINMRRVNPSQFKDRCVFCESPRGLTVTISNAKAPTGIFRCWSCGKYGDQLEFVSLARGHAPKDRRGQYEAAQELFKQFLSVAGTVGTVTREKGTVETVTSSQDGGELQAKLTKILESLVPEHPAVQALGIEPDTARHFQAGFRATGFLRQRLLIPVHNPKGKLIAFCGRALAAEQTPPLLFQNFDPSDTIFNAHRLRKGEDFFITHDPINVLLAYQDGTENVVAVFNDGFTHGQLDLLSGLIVANQCEMMHEL